MSKSSFAANNATEEVLNESEEKAVETTAVAENSVASTSDSQTDTKRYTLTRFLQIKKQKSYVAALLRLNHGSEIHTISEWEELVNQVLAIQCNCL